MSSQCKQCGDDKYVPVFCCSGLPEECGCMGYPVDVRPCPDCNKDGEKSVSANLEESIPFFFEGKT